MSKDGIFVCAEIGVNWSGSPKVMKQLVEEAGAAGADGVKFQMFSSKEIADSRWRDALESMVLHPLDLHYYTTMAQDLGMEAIVTPFYPEAVDMLVEMEEAIDGIKIRARDWLNDALVNKALATKKPVYISVPHDIDKVVKPEGMSPRDFTAAFLRSRGPNARRIYCIPHYPSALQEISPLTAVKCDGYSNHHPSWTIPLMVACNRIMWENQHNHKSRYYLEVHVMPNDADWEKTIDHNVSVSMRDLAELCKAVAQAEELA